MKQTTPGSLLDLIKDLLNDEGWREIALEPCEDGFQVEARHDSDPRGERVISDPRGERVIFGLGPADLDAIARARW